jgi:hypothetical protein
LKCFARAAQIHRFSPEIAGYRAMTLLLMGEKLPSRMAFAELAESDSVRTVNDQYAKLYGQMFMAFLHRRLNEADRAAHEMSKLPVSKEVKGLLFPMETPSSMDADRFGTSAAAFLDVDGIEKHFSDLHLYRASKADITPGE